MSDTLVTLRTDVVIEPLVSRWYAWTHLVSPATAALNTAFRHMALLESFIAAPEIHVAAVQDPAMRGGPFIDQPASAVPGIRQLLADTKEKQVLQLAFAKALRDAGRLLIERADGHSLQALYAQLPEPVRGYLELVYTPGGGADIRLIEALLYASPVYDATAQSGLMHRVVGDHRPFALSTPRLQRPDALELRAPFAHTAYDLLARLRHQPQAEDEVISAVVDAFKLPPGDIDLFRSFLQPQASSRPAPAAPAHPPGKARWRYFGHACVHVESPSGIHALLDPFVAYQSGDEPERLTLADLPVHIDYLVLTHNHQDHVLIETLLALRHKTGTVLVPRSGGSLVDPSLKRALQAIGFENVIELDTLESAGHGDLRITALPFLGEHADLDIQTKAAWLVDAGQHALLFAADSNNIEPRLYEKLRQRLPRLDALFIGMECVGAPLSWLYGPLLPHPPERSKDQSRRLDGSDYPKALQMVRTLGCDQVFIYAMGLEPWLSFISSIEPGDEESVALRNANALILACEELGIPAERLYGKAEAWL